MPSSAHGMLTCVQPTQGACAGPPTTVVRPTTCRRWGSIMHQMHVAAAVSASRQAHAVMNHAQRLWQSAVVAERCDVGRAHKARRPACSWAGCKPQQQRKSIWVQKRAVKLYGPGHVTRVEARTRNDGLSLKPLKTKQHTPSKADGQPACKRVLLVPAIK